VGFSIVNYCGYVVKKSRKSEVGSPKSEVFWGRYGFGFWHYVGFSIRHGGQVVDYVSMW
jgi:hypothetical protein